MIGFKPFYISDEGEAVRSEYDPALTSPQLANSFQELIREVAVLSIANYKNMLFFRGQILDHTYKTSERSTLYPSIYRNAEPTEIHARFDVLDSISEEIVNVLDLSLKQSKEVLHRRKFIKWAILQHYEVCPTPFIDLTQSLHVACSFALHNNNNNYGYIYVIGLPYSSSRIAMDAEQELVVVRLLSICPPEALRPHFQEGYVAGTLDITYKYNKKLELDFNKRLIKKFKIPNKTEFWGEGFNKIPINQLFPDEDDTVLKSLQGLKDRSHRMARSGDIGLFIENWSKLEKQILQKGSKEKQRAVSFGSAIDNLIKMKKIDRKTATSLENLRTFRNSLVHRTEEVEQERLSKELSLLKDLMKQLD